MNRSVIHLYFPVHPPVTYFETPLMTNYKPPIKLGPPEGPKLARQVPVDGDQAVLELHEGLLQSFKPFKPSVRSVDMGLISSHPVEFWSGDRR